jgi:hypothetical protein
MVIIRRKKIKMGFDGIVGISLGMCRNVYLPNKSPLLTLDCR